MTQQKGTRFSLAHLSPTQHREQDDQLTGEQESLAALVASLRELRHHLLVAQPTYVYSSPISFGGPTTTPYSPYTLPAPFDTPCQYAVLQVAFGGAGSVLLSQQSGLNAPAVTATLDPSARTEGQVFMAAGAGTQPGADSLWTDLPVNGAVFLAVTVTTDSAFAVVQFRRRVSPAGLFAEGHS